MNSPQYDHQNYWPSMCGYVSIWRVIYDTDGDGQGTLYVAAKTADVAASFIEGKGSNKSVISVMRLGNLEITPEVVDSVIEADVQRGSTP